MVAAFATVSGAMCRRQRKSPGSQTRWSQGRQGSEPASTMANGKCSGRHGAHVAGIVGPKIATIGTSVVAATCMGPLSPPTKSFRALHQRAHLFQWPSDDGDDAIVGAGRRGSRGVHNLHHGRFVIGAAKDGHHPIRPALGE
jgi:hypothetical protein